MDRILKGLNTTLKGSIVFVHEIMTVWKSPGMAVGAGKDGHTNENLR